MNGLAVNRPVYMGTVGCPDCQARVSEGPSGRDRPCSSLRTGSMGSELHFTKANVECAGSSRAAGLSQEAIVLVPIS